MTLVLTELSEAGIVMAADSAITKFARGRIMEVDTQGWNKLLRVPKIRAGVSYWGMIGAVTPMQFDIWLQRVIDSKDYNDLHSFADHVVRNLNDQCKNRPLRDGRDVGLHIAGYAPWPDGERRPTFIHVHNGHGRMVYHLHKDEKSGQVVTIRPEWQSEPRKLFEKHQDFPFVNNVEGSLKALSRGYITRNGDYSLYAIIWDHLQKALAVINKIPDTSIPRDPTGLGSRRGLLHTVLETMVRLYRCSSRSPTIGGTVS